MEHDTRFILNQQNNLVNMSTKVHVPDKEVTNHYNIRKYIPAFEL